MAALNPSPPPYRRLSAYLFSIFGERVQKVTLDAGLTCPNRDGKISHGGCLYCNDRGSGTGAAFHGKSITAQLQEGMERLHRRYGANKFIAYFQSFSNTYAPLAQLRALYEEALAFPEVVGLSIGTRPDCLTEDILQLLSNYTRTHAIWLELGLQSAHDPTLQRINRGHDAACFTGAIHQAAGRGLHLVAHVILGLPGESRAEMLATAEFLATLPVDGVKIHLLYVAKSTPLAEVYHSGDYQPLSFEDYVTVVVDFLELLPPQMVIHRLTGDPHRGELVAPAWCLDKAQVLNRIHQTMARRGSHQGKALPPLSIDVSTNPNLPGDNLVHLKRPSIE